MLLEKMMNTFEGLEDPRSSRNQKHPFLSLVGIGLLSTLAGHDSFSGMADFGECHYSQLKRLFDLPNGIPSHDTFQRFFDALDPAGFLDCFMLFTEHLASSVKGLTVLDGKTIRNSGKDGKQLHIVSAWCDENRLVLGHVAGKSKGGSELKSMKTLLHLLELEGRIISVDALGCQRDIAQIIAEQNGDYIMALKGNQKNLQEDVKHYFADPANAPELEWIEYDKGHGRIEKRECWALGIDSYLTHHKWPGLRSIAQVKSTRTIKGKETTDTRYYISSLEPNAENICKIARRHWSVENKLHWVLDVTFNEDKCCIRNDNAAENVDIMRKWSLNIINKVRQDKQSIKSIQRKVSMSFNNMINLLNSALA